MSTALHAVMTLVVVASFAAVVAVRHRVTDPERTGRRLGAALLALWLAYNAYYLQPARFAWATSLPLQVCDILAALAAVALLWPGPVVRAIVYFSAIPLASQAVLTPTGDQDPAHLRFWLYWGLHAGIIAAATYDVAVKQYRPDRRDFMIALAADAVYVAVMLPVDLAFGWNYGYIAPGSVAGRTVLDVLGPWPWRLLPMLSLVVVLQLGMLAIASRLRLRGRLHAEWIS